MICRSTETNTCRGARRAGDLDERIDESSGYCVACLAWECSKIGAECKDGNELRERAAHLVEKLFDDVDWSAAILEQVAEDEQRAQRKFRELVAPQRIDLEVSGFSGSFGEVAK